MMLLHSVRNNNPYKKSFYKLFKYVIWLSISLYFLSSLIITYHTISTTWSHSKPYCALMAENAHLDSSTHQGQILSQLHKPPNCMLPEEVTRSSFEIGDQEGKEKREKRGRLRIYCARQKGGMGF
ncbi:putative glucuronoxylan glucuronosyltransferase IRX7 [Salvia divinorum]|uniref:Glucuronoxylan glucuronosyltransferase IRX7 n=1 Tax=Salvia divinorum TaxID=28513 RepID=A0ABD1GMN6_SALDI